MQYRLSTIFLVFFVVAASLALFGVWGLWIATAMCIAALFFNKAKTTLDGGIRVFYVVLIGIICPGLLMPEDAHFRQAGRRVRCTNNLQQIGMALLNYENVHNHFPAVNTCDNDGKPLYSWMVEMLPALERQGIYDHLNKNEPWDNPHNTNILNRLKIREFNCPSDNRAENEFYSNYIAIIGPGTIWRKEGPVRAIDLPNSSVTVMAIECVDSDKHWAEPCSLTVEEALERMKTGEGMRISSAHPNNIAVLFADGHVGFLPIEMPISLWHKLLMGEIKSIDELNDYDRNDPAPINMSIYKPTPKPSEWPFLLSILVWFFSLALLFYRAWDNRPVTQKHATAVE